MQQEVFTPLTEEANIDTTDGFQIVTAKEIMKTGETKKVKMAKLSRDNQTTIKRIRTKIDEGVARDSVK
ncbi:hypothetical protein KAI54_00355 [Candidatus Gracilibacteria bacterium]|nr:hypothetical protein [Candidatus Gracilibacteria bacterium]